MRKFHIHRDSNKQERKGVSYFKCPPHLLAHQQFINLVNISYLYPFTTYTVPLVSSQTVRSSSCWRNNPTKIINFAVTWVRVQVNEYITLISRYFILTTVKKNMLRGVPVPTAWRVLGLRMEERPLDMEVSCEYIE
jgi:hypothetical protein